MDELIAKREQFLAFLISKVSDRALAEDLLQDAFARLPRDVRDSEAYFYRMLRNAVVDRARRERTRAMALEAFAHELPQEEPSRTVCRCVSTIKDELQPSYRDALQRIEVEGVPVKAYADELGISANSAAVRVHRARHALRERVDQTCGACAEAGCLDCTCQ